MEKESIILLASVISALATVILAYLTSRYVKLTYDMVNEIKKSRNPVVIINFIKRIEGHHMTDIDIIISNKGLSPAKDIKLSAVYNIHFFKNRINKGNAETIKLTLNDLSIFRDGISYIGPGDIIRDNIGNFQNETIRDNPLVKINYSYKTETNETIYSNIMPDLRHVPLDLGYLPKEE
jgi:hypothetical protein